MLILVCWKEVSEEPVKKCFAKFHFTAKDQDSTQNDLDDLFIEIRSNMKKLKYLHVVKIPEELISEEHPNCNDTVDAKKSVLSNYSIIAMTRSQSK